MKWFDTTIHTELATSRNFGSDVIVRRSYVFTLQHVSDYEMSLSIACCVNFFGRILHGNLRFLGGNRKSKGVRVSVYCSLPQKFNVKSYQIYCFKKTVSVLWELRFYNWLNFIFNSDRFESNIARKSMLRQF